MTGNQAKKLVKDVLGTESIQSKSVLLFIDDNKRYDDFIPHFYRNNGFIHFSIKVRGKLFGGKIKVKQEL